ncbi:hypothetical protein C4D60_Mb06t15110 [Musa balbisiana]|uniref:Plant heme peroxidase family profile domain-containing protein n=1 Tax=Musa balbisiana TaxID=52838 RepID=A0A4S8IPE7_MUSBA|nr:hypothetical protein C4D60_Mb06t15110 [Musa balbisiana]
MVVVTRNCPPTGGDINLASLDLDPPNVFDDGCYRDLVAKNGLPYSDQELFDGGSQDSLVRQYSVNSAALARDFTTAMVKMGVISPLTGSRGEIRSNC